MSYSELSNRFINTYNELSEYMEKYLNYKDYKSHTQMLNIMAKKNHLVRVHYDELRTFANLRNIIVHDSTSKYNPIADPHIEVVERYESILNELREPPTAFEMATKAKDLVFASPNMRLKECIKIMHDKNYTYMPISQNMQLVGVLSGDSVFTYMRKNQTTTIYDDFRVKDLGDAIRMHMDERYSFVSKSTPLIDVTEMYSNDIQDGKRLGAIFVTERGGENERILGMISPWDLIEYIGKGN